VDRTHEEFRDEARSDVLLDRRFADAAERKQGFGGAAVIGKGRLFGPYNSPSSNAVANPARYEI
jgi:hypothetical protein